MPKQPDISNAHRLATRVTSETLHGPLPLQTSMELATHILQLCDLMISGVYPWNHPSLTGWSIVGMNHYNDPEGNRCLYVAMTKDGRCIHSEGNMELAVWRRLVRQAENLAQN